MCCINREEKEIIESVIVAIYYAAKHWKQSGEVWENRKDIKNINGTDISIPYTLLTMLCISGIFEIEFVRRYVIVVDSQQ